LGEIPCQAGVVKPRPSDVAVGKVFSFAPVAPYSEENHLLVADTLRRLKAENPYIAEVGGENLAALGQSLTGYDEHQNPTGLEPPIGVAQERRLGAATVSRP